MGIYTGREDRSFTASLIFLTLMVMFYEPVKPSVLLPVTLETKHVELMELLIQY
jgi:hypothetical protein